MVDVSAPERGDRPTRARRSPAQPRRPAAIKVAAAGSALAGAMALILVRGPERPEIFIAAGAAVIVSAIVYLIRPRVGSILLIVVGSIVCAVCMAALVTTGTVPWLLTGFWGGSAALLAGLLDLLGNDTTDSMVGATVVAVVSLLLLSALGLGAYVRVTWTEAARTMLEEVPVDVADPAAARLGTYGSIPKPVADGKWACRWTVHTRDLPRTWESLKVAVESAGWSITGFEPGETLSAEKDGYELSVTAAASSTGTDEGTSPSPVELTASVGER